MEEKPEVEFWKNRYFKLSEEKYILIQEKFDLIKKNNELEKKLMLLEINTSKKIENSRNRFVFMVRNCILG